MEKYDSSSILTAHDYCQVYRTERLTGTAPRVIYEGLITSFSDVEGATIIGSDMGENCLTLPSRTAKIAPPRLKVD